MKTKIALISMLALCVQTLKAQVIVERYPNQNARQSITYAADSSYTVLTDYYKNGAKQNVDTLINDHVNGWSTQYNKDGTIFIQQLYDFDKPIVQKFFLYYNDGKLKTEWVSDTLGRIEDNREIRPANGYWKEFYHNGKIKMYGRKNQNKNNDGQWVYFDENGLESKRIFYIDGKALDK